MTKFLRSFLRSLKSVAFLQTLLQISCVGIPGGKNLLTSLLIYSWMKSASCSRLDTPDVLKLSFSCWYC